MIDRRHKTRYVYATAPNGDVLRRRTDREYAFAVLVGGGTDQWTLEACSSTRDGAEKALARFRNNGYRAVVAPVRDAR